MVDQGMPPAAFDDNVLREYKEHLLASDNPAVAAALDIVGWGVASKNIMDLLCWAASLVQVARLRRSCS